MNKAELLEQVLARSPKPIDAYEVAALLESMGWNDKRVNEELGVNDIFEMSDILYKMQKSQGEIASVENSSIAEVVYDIATTLRSFLRGIIFALPMVISIFAILFLKFSVWSYQWLSVEDATSIAIATILSFMVVGGFTQAIARRGFFYISQDFYNMAKKVTFYFVGIGYVICFIICFLLLLISAIFDFFPFHMVILIIPYFIFLSSSWLSVTVMYILKKELVFTGIISLGIILVFILFKIIKLNIILSQIIALVITSIAGIVLSIYLFKKAEKKSMNEIVPPPPRKSLMIYAIIPYFQYGLLYFSFLFTDRIMAWSKQYMPYLIWFNGGYELGLDFALLAIIIPIGFIEVVVSRLMKNLENSQKNSFSIEAKSLNERHLKLYYKSIISVLISAFLSGVLVFIIVNPLMKSFIFNKPAVRALYGTTKVLLGMGILSYGILSIALANSVILFCLSQAKMVVKSISYGIITDILSGFLCSRLIDDKLAVMGLLLGSVVFVCLSTKNVIKVFNKLDYYIYLTV